MDVVDKVPNVIMMSFCSPHITFYSPGMHEPRVNTETNGQVSEHTLCIPFQCKPHKMCVFVYETRVYISFHHYLYMNSVYMWV